MSQHGKATRSKRTKIGYSNTHGGKMKAATRRTKRRVSR